MSLAKDDKSVGTARQQHLAKGIGIVMIRRAQQQILIQVAERFGDTRKQLKYEWIGYVILLV
jgi:hypothetical protein